MNYMKIKNIQALATNQLRADGLAILEAGLLAIDTRIAVKDAVSRTETALFIAGKVYSMSDFDRVRVVAIGKCAGDAVVALYEVIGENIYDGIVIDTRSQKMPSSFDLVLSEHVSQSIKVTKSHRVTAAGRSISCRPTRNRLRRERCRIPTRIRSGEVESGTATCSRSSQAT